ncbi:hypothetical protein DEU56DRAFT_844518 [Suillus clintonianus]|uniref:uncharacterized protein n=1 Tax=Suillus clintonianus TaxID=1904413 RepID=UPI001B8648C5|nr:uncharacterized protein DEU56DRAFT_844518 [Suillus clintonianus]KAG2109752.1 hypothetical protein DEU56DRAFT_844518 [Suillus clintonianus]
MACADALWRIYLQPKEGRDDENSLFQSVGYLRPDETKKMVTKPGFRRMHEVIHHDLQASMLDCWRLEAQSQNREWTTLELFTASKPSDTLDHAREKPKEQQDRRFENQVLRNRDELLYVDVCQAMNAGDIGGVEASFLPWIYLRYNYPVELRCVTCRVYM